MIGTSVREYRILAEIGEGGMGTVYVAEHAHLGRKLAIKVMAPELARKPQFQERFFVEARAQAQLVHDNIVQVTDFFEEGGKLFLVMEYIDGQSLEGMIEARGALDESHALRLFKDALKGLMFAHGKGIIHRDLKSSNILVDRRNVAKLTDFGIALMEGQRRLTQTGTHVGTAWYMSPEQVLRPREVDHRSDIYSMGVVLYEMITGDVPFDGESDFSIKEQHIKTPPPPLVDRHPTASLQLSNLVLKALSKNPADRYESCAELLKELELYGRDLSSASHHRAKTQIAEPPRDVGIPSSPFQTGGQQETVPVAQPGKRKWGTYALAGMLVLLAGVVGVFLFPPYHRIPVAPPASGPVPPPPVESENAGREKAPEPAEQPETRAPDRSTAETGQTEETGEKIPVSPRDPAGVIDNKEQIGQEQGASVRTPDITVEKANRGDLLVETAPAGAQLFLDSKGIGRTPFRQEGLASGTYVVHCKLDGYQDWSQEVRVAPGKSTKVQAVLVMKVPPRATLPPRPEPVTVGRTPDSSPRGHTARPSRPIRPPGGGAVPERCGDIVIKLSQGGKLGAGDQTYYKSNCK